MPESRTADPKRICAGPKRHAPEEILRHQKFPLARQRFLDTVLALYHGDALLTRLMVEAARQVVFSAILCLDAGSDPDDLATWPTLGLLKQSMVQYGLSSPRRIDSLVALLTHNGFLESTLSPYDRRLRILRPTEKMRSTDRDWWAANFLPLQVMFPQPGYGEVIGRDPAFHRDLRRAAMRCFANGAQILGGNPDIMVFLERDAGTLVLFRLAQLAGAPDSGAVELDYKDVGARFGVSRTHVQKILQDAACARLVEVSGRSVALMPRIWRALDRFIVESMSGNDMLFNMARRESETRARRATA
ncbi:MAG: hypothetical protein JO000_14675 [Alphaproteobacteria bacterium]|nr:hypothetical protein [Alphaproteobacteria bacterium]